jgi:hypothetical protein
MITYWAHQQQEPLSELLNVILLLMVQVIHTVHAIAVFSL